MKNVSEFYLEKMKSNLRTFVPRMTIEGVEVDGEIQAGLSVTTGSCGTEQFAIGACFIPTMTASLTECSTRLQDKEILLEMGLKLDDGTIEEPYHKIGYFTVERPQKDKFQTSFTAYGRLMSKAGGVYVSNLTFPAPISSVIDEIKGQLGLNIVLKGFDEDAAEGVIKTPITGTVHREALMSIAGLLGGFVTEDGDGNIVIAKYSLNRAVTIDTDFCYTYPETNDIEYEVAGIGVVVSEDSRDEEGNVVEGEKYYSSTDANVIIQNPYMTAELFETCKNNIVGFSYMPTKVEFLGDISLEPWDSIVLTDEDPDAGIDIPCMNITHVWDGGLATTVTAPGKTATEDAGAFGGPLTKMIERTYQRLLLAEQVIAIEVSTERLKAKMANIGYVTVDEISGKLADFGYVTAGEISGKLAEFGYVTADEIKSQYVETSMANIDEAWIKELLVKGSILTKELNAETGAFTNYLTGVKIYGDIIEGNTIRAESLILQGMDGIYRRLNIDSLGKAVVDSDSKYNEKLDGSVIVAESITADKINVTDLFAQDITANGTITGGVLKSANFIMSDYSIDEEGNPTGSVLSGVKIDLNNEAFYTPQITIKDNYIALNGYMTIGLRTGIKNGPYSLAQGYGCAAVSAFSQATGYETNANGWASCVHGQGSTANGYTSFASGFEANASGDFSVSLGNGTTASGYASIALGYHTSALEKYAHAQGSNTTASGYASTAIGCQTTASGTYSSAQGFVTTASGVGAHAQGRDTEAAGDYSCAAGYMTKALSDYQYVIGKNNIGDNSGLYAFIVGNGTDIQSSNALTIDWSGNANFSGTIKQNGTSVSLAGHTHDDRYFTESEINTKLAGYSPTSHTHSYLPLSGGKITGTLTLDRSISYALASRTGTPFHVWNGDANGMGVRIGDGGIVVIGAGESAPNLISNMSLAASTEHMYLASDNEIYFYTNCQTIGSKFNALTLTGGGVQVKGSLTVGGTNVMLSNEFIYDTYSKSITVPGSGGYTFTMAALRSQSGYTLRGFMNLNNGYGDQWLVSYGVYGSNVVAMVYSKYGASLTSTISCTAIWEKN